MSFPVNFFLVLVFTIKSIACLNAQQPDLPVFKQIIHPFMPAITSEYFYFTEDGLMWFSTSRGLTSFDGSEIIYHSTNEQANQLGLNRISSIAEDRQNNLYIGGINVVYFKREINAFDTISYIFKDIQKNVDLMVQGLWIDTDGLVYFGTVAHGLFIYNPHSKKIEHYNLYPGKPDSWEDRRYNTVVSFAAHATDASKLWLGTFNGIYLFDKKTKKLHRDFEIITQRRHVDLEKVNPGLQLIDVSKMEVVNDSIIWFNSWAGGFAYYNTKTGKAEVFLYDSFLKTKDRFAGYVIRRFAKHSKDKYLLGIFDPHPGLFDIKTKTLEFIKLTNHNFDAVRFVTNDREGNIWILSKGNLFVSVPEYVRLKEKPLYVNQKQGGQLRGLYFDQAKKQYYGALFHSNAIIVMDTGFNTIQYIPTPVLNNYFTYNQTVTQKITKDGSGRYWTAGWENYVMQPGASKFEQVQRIFPGLAWMQTKGEFLDVITDKKGNIIYRQSNGKVFHINHKTFATDTIETQFEERPEIEIKSPSGWYDTSRNCIYLVHKYGISQYNLDTKKNRPIPFTSLYGNLKGDQGIATSALDCDGNVWFMIPKYGIRIIDPESLVCIDSIRYGEKGLIRGDYTAITVAEKPYIFFRSLNGIIVYDYNKKHSYLFDQNNGLSNPENISLLYSNGNLVIGQRGSFEYLALKELQHHTFSVKPALNTIRVDGSTLYINGLPNGDQVSCTIKHNHNSLIFSFSAQEFFLPERIEYAYQLKGIDNDWQYTNSFNRKITYSKLSPGKYTFRLRAQKTGGNWDAQPLEYIIIIEPAFWQTTWFKILTALLVISLITIFIRWRVNTIREKEKRHIQHEKDLFELEAKALRSQMNPHFIFNSLNSIKSLINKNENENAANYLTTFSKLIRTLFQNSDKREVSLYDELETCKLYTQIEKMRFGDKVDFLFDIDEHIDLKDIKVPALILQPFIENAIWHGLVPQESGGKVVIAVKNNNGSVECSIDDDGIGRELSKQYKSLYEATHESKGIGLIKSRLELDKILNEREDTIEIIDKLKEDGTPGGTKVIITFKENNQ